MQETCTGNFAGNFETPLDALARIERDGKFLSPAPPRESVIKLFGRKSIAKRKKNYKIPSPRINNNSNPRDIPLFIAIALQLSRRSISESRFRAIVTRSRPSRPVNARRLGKGSRGETTRGRKNGVDRCHPPPTHHALSIENVPLTIILLNLFCTMTVSRRRRLVPTRSSLIVPTRTPKFVDSSRH